MSFRIHIHDPQLEGPVVPWPEVPPIALLSLGTGGSQLQEYMSKITLHMLLGKGRYGAVYSASDASGAFAIKILRSIKGDTDTTEPFFMKQLDGNEHVLQLQDAIINPFYCILQFPAMEMDLNSYLSACKGRIMPKRNQLSSAKHLTNAVAFLKEKRIIHRDLHSGNVLPLVRDLIGCMQQPS